MSVPLSQQAWEARHRTSLREALEANPELVKIARRYGWFTETLRLMNPPKGDRAAGTR